MALKKPFDTVTIKEASETEITIEGYGENQIPTEPSQNTAGVVAREMMPDKNFKIHLQKGIPPGSGLGSSAASAAATAYALNKIYSLNHTQTELIEIAAKGEEVAAGETHSDNVGPAITGGFCIVGQEIHKIKPRPFKITVVIPEHTSKTKEARKTIPRDVTLEQAKQNIYRAAVMTHGITTGNTRKIGHGMKDTIAEPERAKTIPGYHEIKEKARETGAHGCTISGSGPTIFAVGPNPKKTGKAIQKTFKKHKINSKLIITEPGKGTQPRETNN